jgi:hypothetical protein
MSRRRNKRPPPTTDRRSPEERLEALIRETHQDRADRMMSRILDDLDANPEPAPWVAGARTLSERLVISEDAFYYLAELFVDCLLPTAAASDAELVRIHTEMQTIERAHGLREDDHWHDDEAPDEWRALDDEWGRRADDIVDAYLREHGNRDVADLRAKKRAEFDQRVEKGRVDVWGADEADDHESD